MSLVSVCLPSFVMSHAMVAWQSKTTNARTKTAADNEAQQLILILHIILGNLAVFLGWRGRTEATAHCLLALCW